jgi:hypothetical protein
MKHPGGLLLIAVAAFAVAGSGCGKKDDGNAGQGKGAEGGGGSGSKGAACAEANDVKVTWSAEEMYAPGAFTHSHTLGFLSGMVYNGKSLSKIGYVVLANYDVKLGAYMIDVPTEKGQQAILIQFKTETVPTVMETNKADYAKLTLASGTFQPATGGTEPGFQVMYFVGGENSGPGLTNSESKGTATLTQSKGSLCGSIDFTSPEGSTFKGTFNAAIAKDLWAK